MAQFKTKGYANEQAEKTRGSTKSLKDTLKELMQNPKKEKVNKKVLVSGKNSTGKSSLCLELFTSIMKDDECIIYVDIDNSGLEIVQEFHPTLYQNCNINVMRQYQTKLKNGVMVLDAKETIYSISNTAEAVREILNDGDTICGKKVIGVIVDGISFALDYCEDFMREDQNIGVSEGVSTNIWKIRADKFRDITSAYMNLPLPVIFISHQGFIPELLKEGDNWPGVKDRFLNEVSVRMTLDQVVSEKNNQVVNYVATVRKNRQNLNYEKKEYTFMTRKINKDKEDDIVMDVSELAKMIFPDRIQEKK